MSYRDEKQQSIRDAWGTGTGPENYGESENAVFGAVGLYSLLTENDTWDEGLEAGFDAFIADMKEISMASADVENGIPYDGPDLNRRSVDTIQKFHDVIRHAGYGNAYGDAEAEAKDPGAVYLFGQRISTEPGSTEGLDFVNGFMAVAQKDQFRSVETALEQMTGEERVRALRYREEESVPDGYGTDYMTHQGIDGLSGKF